MMLLPVKSPELVSVFLTIKCKRKSKTIGIYTESSDLICKTFKQNIHLVTLSQKNRAPPLNPPPPLTIFKSKTSIQASHLNPHPARYIIYSDFPISFSCNFLSPAEGFHGILFFLATLERRDTNSSHVP
jgi:hypothetical protein